MEEVGRPRSWRGPHVGTRSPGNGKVTFVIHSTLSYVYWKIHLWLFVSFRILTLRQAIWVGNPSQFSLFFNNFFSFFIRLSCFFFLLHFGPCICCGKDRSRLIHVNQLTEYVLVPPHISIVIHNITKHVALPRDDYEGISVLKPWVLDISTVFQVTRIIH